MRAIPVPIVWLLLAGWLLAGCTPPSSPQPQNPVPDADPQTPSQPQPDRQPGGEPIVQPGSETPPLEPGEPAPPPPAPPPPEPVGSEAGPDSTLLADPEPQSTPQPVADSSDAGPRTAPGMVAEPEAGPDVEMVEDPFVIFEEVAPGETFPAVALDLENKIVRVRGYIALQRGGLEYLACTPRGKTHESLVALQCQPEHLNLALIALGLEPRPQVSEQGQAIALEGDRVVIELLWTQDGEDRCVRVEDLIYDYARDDSMQRVGWVYTGGRLIDDPRAMWEEDEEKRKEYGKVYSANLLGNLGAIFHDPDALLDTPLIEGGNDEAFYAYYERLPPRFTKLHFQVRLADEGELMPLPQPPAPVPSDSTGSSEND